MRTFTAAVSYGDDDGVWYAHLVEEERVHTYGRSLRAAIDHLRDAVALWYEIDQRGVDLKVDLEDAAAEIPKDVKRAWREAITKREALGSAEDAAREATTEAIDRMLEVGWSRRDIAELLGISHQRVQQLIERDAVR